MTNSSPVPPPAVRCCCRLLAPPDVIRRRAALARLGAASLFPVAFDDRGLYVSNESIIFEAPCLFIHHLLCVLFTLCGVFMHFLELTY
jgi:hypothetical protein